MKKTYTVPVAETYLVPSCDVLTLSVDSSDKAVPGVPYCSVKKCKVDDL